MGNENTTMAGPGTAYLIARCESFRKTFTLTKEFTTAGRIGKNDIKLPFGSVSRTHATFVKTPVGYKVVDAGAKHGVVVNGMRVIEKYLQEADKIQIGDVHLLFTFRQHATSKEPAPEMSSAAMPAEKKSKAALDASVIELRKMHNHLLEEVRRLGDLLEALEKELKAGSKELES